MVKLIYRGYDLEPSSNGGYVIKLEGVTLSSQPSLEFAQKWVDEHKRDLAREIEDSILNS